MNDKVIQFAWLIEANNHDGEQLPRNYWTGAGWSTDAFAAARFVTREDGERALYDLHGKHDGVFLTQPRTSPVVCEHAFDA